MRGNFGEVCSGDHHQGTYLAGVWYPDKARAGWWKDGYPEYFGRVINTVDFITIDLLTDDQLVDLAILTTKDFYWGLDMRNGILTRSYTVTTPSNEVRLSLERFLSITKNEAAYICLIVEMLGGNETVKVISKLDGSVQNEDSNYDEHFWNDIDHGVKGEIVYLTTKTIPNNPEIEQFTVTAGICHCVDGKLYTPSYQKGTPAIEGSLTSNLNENETLLIDKEALIFASQDIPGAQQTTYLFKEFNELNVHHP